MRNFYWVKLLFLASITVMASFVQTQGQIKTQLQVEDNPKFITFQKGTVSLGTEKSGGANQVLKNFLSTSNNDEFRLIQNKVGVLQMRHQKFQQYTKGIKVEFATYSVHSKDGYVTTINGDFAPIQEIDIVPSVSEKEALNQAIVYSRAEKFAWQEQSVQEIRDAMLAEYLSKAPKGELVIVKDFYGDKTYKLAYKFLMIQTKPSYEESDMYVDAHTGNLLFKNPKTFSCFHREHDQDKETKVKKPLATGTAATLYTGAQTIETQAYEGGYRLFDETRGDGIHVKNSNNNFDWDFDGATEFVDNDNNWTAEEWNNEKLDNAALEALWAYEKTYDYYQELHNRNSLDDNGIKLRALVHSNTNWFNAQYSGTFVMMRFGDGDNNNPLTTLDITAHELTHGVTDFTADLIYQDESGALNEAFSDIFAAAVEDWSNVGKDVWLIGDDIGHIRNMQDPKEKGDPDTYLGENWWTSSVDFGGVHTNSAVLNHWFYILSVGKQGINDNGDSYNISSLGTVKAAKVAYRMLNTYLTASSGYEEAREAGIQAAIDLYGEGSDEEKQVTNAFYAVGVGETFADPNCPILAALAFSAIGDNEATVSWDALDETVGYDLQYREKGEPDWVSITDITTTSTVLSTLIQGTTYEVRVRTNCSETSFSKYSAVDTFTTTGDKPLVYCESAGNNTSFEYLDRVYFGYISNLSGNDEGYKDYSTEQSTSIKVGETASISLTPAFSSTIYTENFAVWIDYNQDGDFEDEGELAFTATGTSEVQGTITIPEDAKLGSTRMRIVMVWLSTPSPCGTFGFGETEDYTITIKSDGTSSFAFENTEEDSKLYPNPNNQGTATIAIPSSDDIQVVITDTNGQIVSEKGVITQGAVAKGKLNVSSLQPGMYIVRVFGKNNTLLETKKLFIK